MDQSPSYLLRFTLQGLPKTTNAGGRQHWAVKAAEARNWKRAVLLVAGRNKPDSPLKKAKITFTRFSSAEPDFDGLVSSFKHVLDGLVDAGVIVSDKQSTIGQPTYLWKKAPQKQGYIQVDLESED